MTRPDTNSLGLDAADAHLVETVIESTLVYEGSFLKARRDIVRLPNGKSASREYIVHPGAVVVVPLFDDGQLLLERQYRYPVGKVMLEFPAGKLDPNEKPLDCARRELLEETGYTAAQWAYAGAMDLAIAYSTEIIHVFFARGLTAGKAHLDQDEFLELQTASIEDVLLAAQKGQLTDAKTLTCLLWLQNVVSGAWVLDWQT